MGSVESKVAVLLTGLLCFTATTAAAPGTVKGRVLDSLGAPIGRARILLHFDPAGQEKVPPRADVALETNAAGGFGVELQSGFYDVCVFSTAFTPDCRKVLVRSGDTLLHDTKMKVDPLISKHLGDTFR